MKILYASLIAFVLSACQLTKNQPPQPHDFAPSCGKDHFMGLIGQDGATLRDVDLPPITRVIRPGMAVTQDYRPDRLNISISQGGKVDRVWCS